MLGNLNDKKGSIHNLLIVHVASDSNEPIDNCVTTDLCMFVDSNHADNKQGRRSRTSFMIYINIIN